MPPNPPPEVCTAQLREFVRSALPSMLRKLHCWKGLNPLRHADVIEDLHQDLALDCLEHRAEIANLSRTERHARWFRLVERRHYQLRLREGRRIDPGADLDEVSEPGAALDLAAGLLSPGRRHLARRLLDAACYLKNGRINAGATGRQLGLTPCEVRAAWGRIAGDLGYDEEFLCFWRRRLSEALTGLGADMLRETGALHVADTAWRATPDPAARLRRIRSIKQTLAIRPIPSELRRVLTRWTARDVRHLHKPGLPLDDALTLDPASPSALLWAFEAAVATGDLSGAARLLRRARTAVADRVRTKLACARLHEAVGQPARALLLLARARARHRGDPRVTMSLESLLASADTSSPPASRAPGSLPATASTIASSSRRSRRGSPRGVVHDAEPSQPRLR